MRQTLAKALRKFDISKHILDHLVGKGHSLTHRRCIGLLIMIIGISLIQIFHSIINNVLAEVMIDTFGSAVHGIGLIPWISSLGD